MSKFLYLFLFLLSFLLLSSLESQKVHAQQIAIPNISPHWIKRETYDNSHSVVLSKLKSTQAAQDSFFSPKSLLTVIPSVAGGSVIALGSFLTWLNVQKRRKIFKKYMEDIALLETEYSNSVLKNPENRKKSVAKLKEDFSSLQEKADLSAANKMIDDDQRTTIFNTIGRKLEEIGRSA